MMRRRGEDTGGCEIRQTGWVLGVALLATSGLACEGRHVTPTCSSQPSSVPTQP